MMFELRLPLTDLKHLSNDLLLRSWYSRPSRKPKSTLMPATRQSETQVGLSDSLSVSGIVKKSGFGKMTSLSAQSKQMVNLVVGMGNGHVGKSVLYSAVQIGVSQASEDRSGADRNRTCIGNRHI
jgi:hypothetical protein